MPLSGACPACGWSAPVTDGVTDWAPASEAREAEREFYEGEYGAGVGERGEWMVPEALAWLWRNPYYPSRPDRAALGQRRLGEGALPADRGPARAGRLRPRAGGSRGAPGADRSRALGGPAPLGGNRRIRPAVPRPHDRRGLRLRLRASSRRPRRLLHGGRAVFFDDAYAPAWQGAKRTVLRPLMRWSHRRRPISEQDERFTLGGGFRTEELDRLIRAVGGTPFFERSGLVHYVWTRAWERLAPPGVARMATRPAVTSRLARLDRRLARRPRVRANLVRLVWGWDAPDGQA